MLPVPPQLKFHGNTHAAKQFKRFALSQLEILKKQMSFQGLKQGVRRVSPFEGVLIECVSKFGLHVVNVFVVPIGIISDGQNISELTPLLKCDKTIETVQGLIHCVWWRFNPTKMKSDPFCFDMEPVDDTYTTFIFTSGNSIISSEIVSVFSQVRYFISEGSIKIGSTLYYSEIIENPYGPDSSIFVIRVLGEIEVPNYTEKHGSEYKAIPYIALSYNLDTIYITTVPFEPTGFNYKKMVIIENEWNEDYSGGFQVPEEAFFVSGCPDRTGNAGSFFTQEEFTNSTYEDSGFTWVTGSRTTLSTYSHGFTMTPYSFSLNTETVISSDGLTSGLVLIDIQPGQWDYYPYRSVGTLERQGWWTEKECASSWVIGVPPPWTTGDMLLFYEGGFTFTDNRGDNYGWGIADIVDIHGFYDEYQETSHSDLVQSYNGVNWSHAYSWTRESNGLAYMHSFKKNAMNYVILTKDGETYSEQPLDGGTSGDYLVWGISDADAHPCGNIPAGSSSGGSFLETILYHPCKSSISPAFDSAARSCAHDQETGLTFYKYSYALTTGGAQINHICVRTKDDTEIDITSQVYDAIKTVLNNDIAIGAIPEMTPEEQTEYCDQNFMYIYFEATQKTVTQQSCKQYELI